MTNLLTLLASGRPLPERGRSVVLVDGQWYAEDLFKKAAGHVVAGAGVDVVEQEGRTGFMLSQEDRNALARVDSCDARVLFFVSTDTEVKTLMPIAQKCSEPTFIVHSTTDRSALEALDAAAVPFEIYRSFKLSSSGAQLAVLIYDAGFERRAFLGACRRNGICTVCLQEAANVDFNGAPYRMRWADIALVQGPHALQYLDRDVYFLTGNPRFDAFQPLPPPGKPLVLINCNFIFGLSFLEWARPWTEQVIRACEALGLPYRITVHPRDETDLSGLENVQPSGAYKVREQLAQCSVLVSRDSSLPYEALRLNRRVVYYDPFGEKEHCLREDDTGFIDTCTDADELAACIEAALQKPPPLDMRAQFDRANQYLFTSADGACDLRVIRALHAIVNHPDLYTGADARKQAASIIVINRFLHVTLRPKIRRIAWLRRIWRALKWLKMKLFGY
ncbi:MAG: hypothetical protein IID09_07135 [Candidatus Hydrogenedentes bacterium]|nr:hypothetical protein [Candidatus Hydrogenedentota bacterium]